MIIKIVGYLSIPENKTTLRPFDYRVQKLVNVIYHTIMRQGSNLQKLNFRNCSYLPKTSIFTTYKPGITNLRSIYIDLVGVIDINQRQPTELLSIVPKFCNDIVCCELFTIRSSLGSVITELFLDIIKSQPLEKMIIYYYPNNMMRNITP